MTETLSINDISNFLLTQKYLLTALELDFELIERGIENKVLRNYFTNPENFDQINIPVESNLHTLRASPSISTIDSIDFNKSSDDGQQLSDDRIKVLEFELRKKNDEVKKLREELTLISTCKADNHQDLFDNSNGPIIAHENRALNFLINEYLMSHGYKLTSVAFSEEITDQDLDSWDDVGLNIPKLANLESFLRNNNSMHNNKSNTDDVISATLTIESDNRLPPPESCQEVQTDAWVDLEKERIMLENNELNEKSKKFEDLYEKQVWDCEQLKEKLNDSLIRIEQLTKESNENKNKFICLQRDLSKGLGSNNASKKKQNNTKPTTDQTDKPTQLESSSGMVANKYSTSVDTDYKSESLSVLSDDVIRLHQNNSSSNLSNSGNNDEKGFEEVATNDNGEDMEDYVCYMEENRTEHVNEKQDNSSSLSLQRNVPSKLKNLVELIDGNFNGNISNAATSVSTNKQSPQSIALVENLDDLIDLITDMLPRLFKATKDNMNPDIMLLLVQSACLHRDSKKREELLKFLIYLYTDPTEDQRMFVLKQIRLLASYLGEFRIESELITQIWEILLYEKTKLSSNLRILIACICGVVSPVAPAHLRSSLILSIHLQMLEEEPQPQIVAHIIRALSSTIPYLHDADKISIILPIIGRYLYYGPIKSILDSDWLSESVSITNQNLTNQICCRFLLPVLAQWSLDNDWINENDSIFNEKFLGHINDSLKVQMFKQNEQNLDDAAILFHYKLFTFLLSFIEVWMKQAVIKHSDVKLQTDSQNDSLDNSKLHYSENFPEILQMEFVLELDQYILLNSSYQHAFINFQTEHIADFRQFEWMRIEIIGRIVEVLLKINPKNNKLMLTDDKVIAELAKNQFTVKQNRYHDLTIQIGQFLYELMKRLRTNSCSYDLANDKNTEFLDELVQKAFLEQLYTNNYHKKSERLLDNSTIISGIVSGYCAIQMAIIKKEPISVPESNKNDNSSNALLNLRRFLTDILFMVSAEHLALDGIKLALSTLQSLCCNCSGINTTSPKLWGTDFFVEQIVLPALQPCLVCPERSVQILVCLVIQEVARSIQKSMTANAYSAILEIIINMTGENSVVNFDANSEVHDSDNQPPTTLEVIKVMCVGVAVVLLQTESDHAIYLSSLDSVRQKTFDFLSDLMNESVNFKNINSAAPSTEVQDQAHDNPTKFNQLKPCSEIYITTLIQMVNLIGPISSDNYRNEVILPWLFGVTEINNATSDTSRRSSIAMILYSTFSTLSYYLEAKKALESFLLPSLDRLKLDMQELYPESVKEVELMSQEVRRRFEGQQKSSILSISSSSTTVSDMSQAVRNKFNSFSFKSRIMATPTPSSATSSHTTNKTNITGNPFIETTNHSSSPSAGLQSLFSRRTTTNSESNNLGNSFQESGQTNRSMNLFFNKKK